MFYFRKVIQITQSECRKVHSFIESDWATYNCIAMLKTDLMNWFNQFLEVVVDSDTDEETE